LSIVSNSEEFWERMLGESDQVDDTAELARRTLEVERYNGQLFIEMERKTGAKIRAQRIRSDLSQSQVAERMTNFGFEISQSTMAKIESGKRPIRLAEIFAFEAVLGLPYMALVQAPFGTGELDDDALALLRGRLDRETETKARAIEQIQESVQHWSTVFAQADASILWLSHQIAAAAGNAIKGAQEGLDGKA
jgi:transcriptional regulator with XRE-family HTH domain